MMILDHSYTMPPYRHIKAIS